MHHLLHHHHVTWAVLSVSLVSLLALLPAHRLSHHQCVVCPITSASFVPSPVRRLSHQQRVVCLIANVSFVSLLRAVCLIDGEGSQQQISNDESSSLSGLYASFVTLPTYYLCHCQHVCYLITSELLILLSARRFLTIFAVKYIYTIRAACLLSKD